MKKSLIAFLAIVAIPLSLSAGSYCSSCQKGSRSQGSSGKHHNYSKNYEYDIKYHQNSVDHFVTEEDQRIAGEVRDNIKNGNFANTNDIQVFVEYGKVILEGKVLNSRNKQAAEEAALQVIGVRNVVNGLYVDNRPSRQENNQNGNHQGNNHRG